MNDDVEVNSEAQGEQPIEAMEQPDLVVGTFADEISARGAFEALRNLQKDQQVLLAEVALVLRDNNNTLHISEPDDMEAPEGALYGGTIGAIVGMFAGPLGLVVGGALGAMIGGAAARTSDADVEDKWLTELGSSLQPGSGMVVTVVPGIAVAQVSDFLGAKGGKVLTRAIDPEMAAAMGMPELEPPDTGNSEVLERQ